MGKYTAIVEIEVTVEIDEKKFDEAFLSEFRESFYPFHSVDDHVEHLAQLEARGILRDDFIEGYGPASDMGIKTNVVDWSTDIQVRT